MVCQQPVLAAKINYQLSIREYIEYIILYIELLL